MKNSCIGMVSIVILASMLSPHFAMSSESNYIKRTSKELDVLLGPIALYPDVLLAQIFPASTFPDQVGLAYQWVVIGKTPAEQIDEQPWDDSIKALARYPDILTRMNQNIDWVSEMGDVFIHQQEDVLSSVQQLRVTAKAAGTLADTKEQKVVVVQEVIRIEPADPQIIYVPQYNPQVVYVEKSDTVSSTDAARIGLLSFGAGVALGAWLNKDCDYHHGGIYYPRYGYGAVAGPHRAYARGPNGAIAVGPNGGVAVGRNGAAAWSRSTPYAAPRYNTAYRQNGNVNINVDNRRTINNNVNNNNINRNINNSNNNGNVNNFNNRTSNNLNSISNSNNANRARSTPTTRPAQNAAANTYTRGSEARKSSQRGSESRTPQGAAAQPSTRPSQASSGRSFGSVNRAPQVRAQSSRGQASRGGGGGGRRR